MLCLSERLSSSLRSFSLPKYLNIVCKPMDDIFHTMIIILVSEGNIFEAGQPCCAKYTQDDCWYRAQILTVTEDSVSVYFVDFGNMETLSKDRVRPLLPEFCSLSPQVIHCSVADIKPICDTWIEGELSERKRNIQ